MSLLTTIEGELPKITAALPNLGAVLPAVARAAHVAEGVALVMPGLIADILRLRSSPSVAAIEKLVADLEAAWSTVTVAIAVGTVAEPELVAALNAAKDAAHAAAA